MLLNYGIKYTLFDLIDSKERRFKGTKFACKNEIENIKIVKIKLNKISKKVKNYFKLP